jgi:hypothetical protein
VWAAAAPAADRAELLDAKGLDANNTTQVIERIRRREEH